MLDLWRPQQGAGDPIGCLATTFTFAPELFDEQCLARFLEIESEPNREDLAFLLERENKLGGVYAGVLVDHTQAGVAHSLRWDVLSVRIRGARQHAKLSLLAWSHNVRIVVASANLTNPGYRLNHEVATAVDLMPNDANLEILADAIGFLKRLLEFAPGASERSPEVMRAESFLDHVARQTEGWAPSRKRGKVRQQLVCTIPGGQAGRAARSSLDEAVDACRRRGASPSTAWVASPFFDADGDTSRVTAALCKQMARGGRRQICFCVPSIPGDGAAEARLAAPVALLKTPPAYQGVVTIKTLPDLDGDKNRRAWHAKMLALIAEPYSALMIGSSNFTCAGMGVTQLRNAEANILTIVDRVAYGRDVAQLEGVWPDMEQVANPESAEWLGARPDNDEEAMAPPLPAGFLSATYRAGDKRQIILRMAPDHLPEEWRIHAFGPAHQEILSAAAWRESGRPSVAELGWAPVYPPEKVLVRWADHEAFLPLNVEDSRQLPPPAELQAMPADAMLLVLAATDPSAAFRAWATWQKPSDTFDTDLDSATPVDLDPLRRHDLQATFLHRIRRRARILAQLRSNLQRPVWGQQALEWRLRGLIGVEPLADRFVREFAESDGRASEALLALTDFLIVLSEVVYAPCDGSLPKPKFDEIFGSFLKELADKLQRQVDMHRDRVSEDLIQFWMRVVKRCQR